MLTAIVTAGPTREHLDDVRFLANGSSGKMGYAIAAELVARGVLVHLVSGPVELEPPRGAELHSVVSALEMQAAVERLFPACDVVIAVAAVADYRPRSRAAGKPPKSAAPLVLELVPNPDIVGTLGAKKGDKTLVGFALEDVAGGPARALQRGREKLARKGLDMIVVNLAAAIGAEDVQAWIVRQDGTETALPRAAKPVVARAIVDQVLALCRARRKGGDS